MMLFFFAMYLLICLYGIKPHFKSSYNYLSREVTTSVKGVFILMVFFSHFNSYVQYNNFFDKLYLLPFSLIGQAMVTMFLFYSGYGVMEQIKNRENYVDSIPVNRILSTLFNCAVAVIIYAVLSLILKEKLTIKAFLLSLIGWESLGNSNWYIFAVLCMYLSTYISFKVFSKDHIKAAVLNLAITILYIAIMRYIAHKPMYWHDTVLVYSLGIFWSLYRVAIEKCFKNNIVCLILLFAMIASYYLIRTPYIKNIVFTLGFLIFTYRIAIGNKILNWCGNYLFEIYILQRIPMIILTEVGYMNTHTYVSFVICILFTVVSAVVFKKCTVTLWKLITTH